MEDDEDADKSDSGDEDECDKSEFESFKAWLDQEAPDAPASAAVPKKQSPASCSKCGQSTCACTSPGFMSMLFSIVYF